MRRCCHDYISGHSPEASAERLFSTKTQVSHQVEIRNARPMPIPLPLLEVADQSNETVAAYRTQFYPATGPQEPRVPSPEGPPERSEARAEPSAPVRGEPQGRSSPPADSERTVSEHRGGDGQEGATAEIPRPTSRPSRPVRKARPHAQKIRVPRMSTGTAVCSAGPAQVVAIPTTHEPEPDHLVISQQVTVSFAHGDIAQPLPEVHSEPQGIEVSHPLPQLTTCPSARVIEPFDIDPFLDFSFDRTPPSPSSPTTGIRYHVGTIGSSVSTTSEMRTGSPTIDIITPAVSVGTAVFTSSVVTTVTTVPLSETNVSL